MTTHSPEVVHLAHAVLKPGFDGRRMPDWLAEAVDHGLSAVCYFGHNIGTVEETAALSDQLHGRGLGLISTDEEGGIVSRLGVHTGSRHVGAAMLGRADDVELTTSVAAGIAADLRDVGIDVDLAPVVDVNSNPDNPVIGVRSFGADPELVARHAAAYVHGLQGHGVAACAKHFPGHGDTAVDSHVGLPRIEVSQDMLRKRELVPFRAAVDAGVQMVMTAHIIVPSLDPDHPATLSSAAMRLLRKEIGFTGVIATDALDMGAIRDTVGLGQGCVDALLAGADLLGLGNPVLNRPGDTDLEVFRTALSAIVEAVESGALPIERLAEAKDRIEQLISWQHRQVDASGSDTHAETRNDTDTGTDAGTDADDRVATAALGLRGHPNGALHGRMLRLLDVRRQRNVASGALTNLVATELMQRAPGSTLTAAFELQPALEGHAAERPELVARGSGVAADVIITAAPWSDDAEMAQLRAALRQNGDAVVICMGSAAGSGVIPEARHLVLTWGDSLPTARAVAELLL